MISYTCIVIAIFIPLICAAYAKFSVKGYDNKTPREFLDSLEGKGKRANFAQKNFYESFPAFAVGVVTAHQLGVTTTRIDALAITYVIARILFAFFYIQDNSKLRTIAWFVAFISILTLYISAIV